MTCVLFFQIVLICVFLCLSSQFTWLNSKSKFCLLWGGQWLKSLFTYFSFRLVAWNLPQAFMLHGPAKIWVNFVCRNWNFPLMFSLFQDSSHHVPVAMVEPKAMFWFLKHKMAGSNCLWVALQVTVYGLTLVEKNRKLTPCYFLFPSMASPPVSDCSHSSGASGSYFIFWRRIDPHKLFVYYKKWNT